MPDPHTDDVNVEFVRLLFRSRVQEEVAHRWASRLARLLGPRIMQLRPGTTLAELLAWATTAGVESIEFAFVFEPELRLEFAEFLDHAEHVAFRELVEHYTARFEGCL